MCRHTPKRASWLNMAGLWFSILTRRLLRRGQFASREHLAGKIIDFIIAYDGQAKPFRWSYDGLPSRPPDHEPRRINAPPP